MGIVCRRIQRHVQAVLNEACDSSGVLWLTASTRGKRLTDNLRFVDTVNLPINDLTNRLTPRRMFFPDYPAPVGRKGENGKDLAIQRQRSVPVDTIKNKR